MAKRKKNPYRTIRYPTMPQATATRISDLMARAEQAKTLRLPRLHRLLSGKAFCLWMTARLRWIQRQKDEGRPWGTWRQGIWDY